MIISVNVKTNQKHPSVTFDGEKKSYLVCVKSPPENNRANVEVIKLISKHLGKKARIFSGLTSKRKLISV